MATDPGGIDVPVGLDLGNALRDIKAFAQTIQKATTDAEKLGAALKGAFGNIPQNGKAFQQALRSIASGGQDAAAVNARIRGLGAQGRASPEGQFAQIARQQANLLRDIAKGGKDALSLLSLSNTEINKGNRLAQQRSIIIQRELNLAKALQQSGGEYNASVARAQEKLQKSNDLLAQMNTNQKQAVSNAKYLEGVKARSAFQDGRAGFAEYMAREREVQKNEDYLSRLRVRSAIADGKSVLAEANKVEQERIKQVKISDEFLSRLKLNSAMADGKAIIAESKKAEQQKAKDSESLINYLDGVKRRSAFKEFTDAVRSAKTLEQEKKKIAAEEEQRLVKHIRLVQESNRIEEQRQKREAREAAAAYRASPQGIREADDKARARRYDIAVGDGGAALFKLQARLLAQYQVLGSIFNSLQGLGTFIVDLDKGFAQLQAISGATNEEMQGLGRTIIDVSKNTKFSAVEIADAATTLAQAGFSVKEIQDSIGAVTLLATATGSTLQESVDLASSVVTVFNLRAQEMGNIANVTTGALNLTKLTVDKLALGVQYAGNIAADAGESFTDLTAVLGAAADAGIRSGSTLGTGYRQLVTELENPTKELRERLKELGVGFDQIDVKSNGVVGVLKNLVAAGFSTADALKTMDVRGAAFFSAISKGIPEIDNLREALLFSDAAAKANAVQMESLAAKFAKFANASGIAASEISSGLVTALKKALDGATALVGGFGDLTTAGKLLGTVLLSVVAGGAAAALVRMVGLAGAIGSLITAIRGAALAGTGIAGVFATLSTGGVVAIAVGALVTAVAALTGAFGLLSDKSADAEGKLAKVTARLNESRGKLDTARQSMSSVKDALAQVSERSAKLKTDQGELNVEIETAKQRFGDLGFTMEGLPETFDGLSQAYLNLIETLQKPISTHLGEVIQQTKQAIDAQQNVIKQKFSSPGREKFIDEHGLRIYAPDPDLPGVNREVGLKPQTPAVDAGLKALDSQSLEEVTRAIANIMKEQGGTEEEKKLRADLVKVLQELSGNLSEIKSNQLGVDRLTGQQAQAKLIEKVGVPTETALQSVQVFQQDQSAARLTGVKDSKERERIAKEIQEAAGQLLSDAINSITKDLTPEEIQTFNKVYGDRIKSKQVEIKGRFAAIVKENQEAKEKADQLEIQTLEDEISVREKILSSTKDAKKRDQLKKEVIEKLKQKEALELELLKTNKDLQNAAPDIIERAKANIRAQTQAAIDDLMNRDRVAANRPSKAPYVYRAFRDNENRETKDRIEQVNQARDRELYRVEQPSRYQQFRTNSYDLLRNQGKVTDSQKYQAALQQERLETQRLKDVAAIENQRLLDLKKVLAEAQIEYEKKLAEFNNLDSEAKSFKGTKEAGEELMALRDKAGREAEAINSTIIKSQDAVAEATQKSADAQAEYNARIQETKDIGIGEAMRGGLEEWGRQEGIFDSAAVKIQKVMQQIAGSVRDNLADAFYDVATRTKTMSEAFKDFGKVVIDTLIRIAAQQAANALIGLLINAGGGGGTTQAANAVLQNGQPRWQGGKIRRAAGGKVPGSVKTRDSVNAYLAPDEWVINSSAAKSIGDKKMSEINQKGAAALQSNPIVPITVPPPPAPVNVWTTTQDQIPPPGPNDIIAIIGNDIRKGGVTKQLIKSVGR